MVRVKTTFQESTGLSLFAVVCYYTGRNRYVSFFLSFLHEAALWTATMRCSSWDKKKGPKLYVLNVQKFTEMYFQLQFNDFQMVFRYAAEASSVLKKASNVSTEFFFN